MLASLDATHVRSMQPAVIGERFLRKAVLRPQFTNALPENNL
jgi:hypothetical protein